MSTTDSSSSSKSFDEDELSSSSASTVSPTVDNNPLSEPVLKKFKWALQKVKTSKLACENHDGQEACENAANSKQDTALTETELINLIKSWEPKRDIICLYVRWSRQLRRNFNLDSISTLLCLSRQCGYTPINFITKVKTLTVYRSHKHVIGVTFHFGIAADRKEVNEESLNKEYLGLSVTLSLLQEQVSESPSILGKVGMRHTGPRVPHKINIPLVGIATNCKSQSNEATTTTMETHPNVEFHTQQSMLNRIWKSINHRWIAYYLLEHLFREENVSWVAVDGLVYSFQMMSPCGPVRYEFLCPIVGFCLRFQTIEIIKSHRDKLRQIHKDPKSFHGCGCSYQQQYPVESQAQIIISTFKELICNMKRIRLSYHRRVPEDLRWTMLRAYVFHFWLESTTNQTLRTLVSTGLNSVSSLLKGNDIKTSKLSELPSQEIIDTSCFEITTEKQNDKNTTLKKNFGFETIISSRRRIEVDSTHENDLETIGITTTSKKDVSSSGGSEWKLSDTKWSSLRLASSSELNEMVRSFLLIHRVDGVVIISELSPFEVYSANNLHKLEHYRTSKKPPYSPTNDLEGHVKLMIDTDTDYFLDMSTKTLHVARENCACFKEYSNGIPSLDRIRSLCHAVVLHGEIDEVRGIGQYRCNIGNGGQNWVNNSPCELHGLQFEKKLKTDSRFNSMDVLITVGEIMEFTWNVCNSMQNDANEYLLAPNRLRKQMYACRLNEYLGIASRDVGFEDLTIVVSCLHPVIHEVKRHRDTMNDSLVGYTRSAAFNLVLIDDTDPSSLSLIHFQILFNFRKIIGRHMISFHQLVSPITSHARQYVDKWNRSIYSVYASKTDKVPSIYDRWNMFLDDSLEYSKIQISDTTRGHKDSIFGEYILTEVGISRTLSMSMFLDPLFHLQKYLKTDQLVELVFTCSFMSNPFWFNWTMCKTLENLKEHNDSFNSFQIHPFYDWHDITLETFGTWQGGPYNRWSPCGGSNESIPELFGAHKGASINDRKRGERRLTDIVSVLIDHIHWINSLADSSSKKEIDVETIKLQYETIIKCISNIVPCQFHTFRLCIFTTIIAGCGILQQGKHLRQLMFPIPNSASFKHLSNPMADLMTTEKAYALGHNQRNEAICNDGKGYVTQERHDVFMRYLSIELGFKVYCRDEIECILGESHPMRTLNCKDWFRKGMTIFDCNNNGEYFMRRYGNSSEWTKLPPPVTYQFAFHCLPFVYYEYFNETLILNAIELGKELRSDLIKLSYKGRTSKTSCKHKTFTNNFIHGTTYSHASIQIAYFYVGLPGNSISFSSMYVLGDGDKAVPITSCNNIVDHVHGTQVVDTLKNTFQSDTSITSDCISAGSYHRDPVSDDDEVTFLPGHRDKAFVKTACFVPVGLAKFFIIVAIPHSANIKQDTQSMKEFNEWKIKISEDSQHKINNFLKGFETEAKMYMRKNELLHTYIYVLCAGSILRFPANTYYHATILPKRGQGIHRDLLIFHPLDGCS